jgi:hypothetical protein
MEKKLVMKGKNGEMTMSRYVIHLAVVLLGLTGLIFLLGCEKEGVEVEKGELVDMVFTISNGGYEEENTFTRSEKIKGEKAKIVPLEEGLYLSATLREAEALGPAAGGGLRASLAVGQKVVLAAFVASDLLTVVATELYKVESGGALVPDDEEHPLRVPTGPTYHFVAYSFNSGVEPRAMNIDPANDLMWGITAAAVEITGQDQPVVIVMGHLFSQVQMVMDVAGVVDANGVAGKAEVKTLAAEVNGGLKVDLTVGTGDIDAISGNSDATQALVFAGLPNEEAESDLRTVTPTYPGRVSVTIDQMVIEIESEGEYTIEDQTIVFDGEVVKGKTYVLAVELLRTRWAWSNIYIEDDSHYHMAFDRSAPPTPVSKYPGLFFKWGSLVGISPHGSSPYIYTPAEGSEWGYAALGSGWGSIKTIAAVGIGNSAENYLTNHMDRANQTGDICTRIDPAWRMPNANEFGVTAAYDWAAFAVNGSVDYDSFEEGKGDVGAAIVTYGSPTGDVFFPAAGYRTSATTVVGSGEVCYYWSGSVGQALDAGFLMSFKLTPSPGVNILNIDRDGTAAAVRCIRKLASEMP